MANQFQPEEDIQLISGRLVICCIFGFAITMIAVLYFYWKMHTGPFLPVQQALANEFPGCQPLVQGGQRKMHKGTPKILRTPRLPRKSL